MKTMTCRELGGPCDRELSSQTWDEMVRTMTKHVMENHPDTAKAMEKQRGPQEVGPGDETQVGCEGRDLAAAVE